MPLPGPFPEGAGNQRTPTFAGGKEMNKQVWTVEEVIKILNVDENLIAELEKEEVITLVSAEDGTGKLLPGQELDKIRVAKVLMEEMDINLPGVEVILRMRQNMFEMRRQFDDILKDLAEEIRKRINQRPPGR